MVKIKWIKGNTPKHDGRYWVTELVLNGTKRVVDSEGYVFKDGEWSYQGLKCFVGDRINEIVAYAPFVELVPYEGE